MKFLILFLIVSFGYSQCDSIIDNDVYIIEQSIDSGDFSQIAQVNLRHLKQSQNTAQYQSIDSDLNDRPSQQQQQQPPVAPIQQLTELETLKLDKSQLEQIQSNRHNNNSIYNMRMCKRALVSQQPQQKCFTSTFTYLRNVIQSNMALQLTIHTGLNNNLNSIAIKAWSTRGSTAEGAETKALKDRVTLYATVQVIRSAQGPDTETYLEKLRIEKEQKEKSAQSGNESFLSKYWIYIVPFVIIMFLMNIVNPEAGAAGAPAR